MNKYLLCIRYVDEKQTNKQKHTHKHKHLYELYET